MHKVYLYTEKQDNMIFNNDSFFKRNVASYDFKEKDLEAIRVIDHAKLLGKYNIESEYGVGTIDHLSTGCKTILNILHNRNRVVNISGCGENALNFIFGIPDARLYAGFPMRVKMSSDTVIVINDKCVVNDEREYNTWWEKEYKRRELNDL